MLGRYLGVHERNEFRRTDVLRDARDPGLAIDAGLIAGRPGMLFTSTVSCPPLGPAPVQLRDSPTTCAKALRYCRSPRGPAQPPALCGRTHTGQ
jgi:hypothetical protein